MRIPVALAREHTSRQKLKRLVRRQYDDLAQGDWSVLGPEQDLGPEHRIVLDLGWMDLPSRVQIDPVGFWDAVVHAEVARKLRGPLRRSPFLCNPEIYARLEEFEWRSLILLKADLPLSNPEMNEIYLRIISTDLERLIEMGPVFRTLGGCVPIWHDPLWALQLTAFGIDRKLLVVCRHPDVLRTAVRKACDGEEWDLRSALDEFGQSAFSPLLRKVLQGR